MSCNLSQGFTLDCRDGMGGSKEFYIIEQGNVTPTVVNGVVTAISVAAGKQFFKYNQVKQTSEVEEQLTVSEENGSLFAKQTVKLVLNKKQTTVRNELMTLAKNLLVIIGVDRNGNAWLYGLLNGLELAPSNAKSGKAMGDRNGYELTFEGAEPELAPSVDPNVMTTVMTGVTPEMAVTFNYATLSGATPTERDALIAFTNGLVADNLYNDFIAFWPLVGSSAVNKRFNLMDPLDEDSSFRLAWGSASTPLNHAKGLQMQGTSGHSTFIDPSLLSGLPTVGMGAYAQDALHQYFFLSGTGGVMGLGFGDAGKVYVNIGAQALGVPKTTPTGLLYGFRTDTNTVKSYQGDTEFTSETLAIGVGFPSTSLVIVPWGGYVASAFFVINTAWDATKRTAFKNRMNTLMTALGR